MITGLRLQTSDFRHQKLFDFAGAAGELVFVVHQIGADEHQCRELLAVLLVVLENDV